MRPLLLTLPLLLLTACPRPTPTSETPADAVDPALKAHLTLPPGTGAGPALKRLAADARAGKCAAAWTRARYLLDMYDAARVQPALTAEDRGRFAATHLLLWSALELPGGAGRGRLATLQVQTRLEAQFKGIPARCQEAALARLALELLAADRAPRADVPPNESANARARPGTFAAGRRSAAGRPDRRTER